MRTLREGTGKEARLDVWWECAGNDARLDVEGTGNDARFDVLWEDAGEDERLEVLRDGEGEGARLGALREGEGEGGRLGVPRDGVGESERRLDRVDFAFSSRRSPPSLFLSSSASAGESCTSRVAAGKAELGNGCCASVSPVPGSAVGAS
jgi:hypothetical protein